DDARERVEGWSDPRDDWSRFARYNLGVALVRLGRVEEGTALLDAVGRQGRSGDAESLAALRDKANVAVGYAWLQADLAERARDSLRRVRLNGAFSIKALLGAGWD